MREFPSRLRSAKYLAYDDRARRAALCGCASAMEMRCCAAAVSVRGMGQCGAHLIFWGRHVFGFHDEALVAAVRWWRLAADYMSASGLVLPSGEARGAARREERALSRQPASSKPASKTSGSREQASRRGPAEHAATACQRHSDPKDELARSSDGSCPRAAASGTEARSPGVAAQGASDDPLACSSQRPSCCVTACWQPPSLLARSDTSRYMCKMFLSLLFRLRSARVHCLPPCAPPPGLPSPLEAAAGDEPRSLQQPGPALAPARRAAARRQPSRRRRRTCSTRASPPSRRRTATPPRPALACSTRPRPNSWTLLSRTAPFGVRCFVKRLPSPPFPFRSAPRMDSLGAFDPCRRPRRHRLARPQ